MTPGLVGFSSLACLPTFILLFFKGLKKKGITSTYWYRLANATELTSMNELNVAPLRLTIQYGGESLLGEGQHQ